MITITDMSASAKKFGAVYEAWMQPLCQKMGMPFTALCIFMFFANNPDKNTAQQLCEERGYKRAIVSMHIERLVQRGLLRRTSIEGDRRKWGLVCTEKADAFVREGRRLQKLFGEALVAGLADEDLKKMEEYFNILRQNLEVMSAEGI